MLVEGKISADVYENLINYACKKCDAVMFVFRKDGFDKQQIEKMNENVKSIKKRLCYSFIKNRNGGHWVFTKVGNSNLGIYEYPDPSNFDDLFEIIFYETSKCVQEYLLTNTNLYTWLNPIFPEDISFFKNGYCWLYSVAHEKLCFIYCEDEEEYEYLKSIGIKFVDDKFISTSKEELYFENFLDN